MPPDDFDLGPPDEDDRDRPASPLVGMFRVVLYTLTAAVVIGPGALLLTTMFNPDWESERARVESTSLPGRAPSIEGRAGSLTSVGGSEQGAWSGASSRTQWAALARLVKSELCDQGTHARVARCEASLDTWFTEARFNRYARCVEGGGPTPVLRSFASDDSVPTLAERIDTPALTGRQHWYLVFCDPSEVGPAKRAEDVAIVQ